MNQKFELKEKKMMLPIPARYSWTLPASGVAPKEVIVFLHGYMERAERIAERVEGVAPSDAAVLIPNGPFPVPFQKGDSYKDGYAWYFYDVKTNKMLVSPETSVVMIQQILKEVGAERLPLRIVGFSQGGYFAPNLASHLNNVRQVVVLSAGFPERYFLKKPNFRLDAVHGSLDTICPYETAKTEFHVLKGKGWAEEFVTVTDVAHKIDDKVRAAVARLLTISN